MSTTLMQDVLRPAPGGFKGRVMAWVIETLLPFGFRVLRFLRWNWRFGKLVVVTRYGEVREVFLSDPSFRVPYAEKLNVIMGGHPFFLSVDNTEEYRRDTEAMCRVIRITDIPERLIPEVERLGEKIVAGTNGRLDVVNALVRQITFDLYEGYFGIPNPPGGDLRLWATRLFEFQFVEIETTPRDNDDQLLAGYVFEAMRFDPLAPFLPRVATSASTIGRGTPRAVNVPAGARVLVAFGSTVMDERRLPNPRAFNPRRLPHEYIHFGYGLHQCVGIHMNKALLPLMLKALLQRPNLRRVPQAPRADSASEVPSLTSFK